MKILIVDDHRYNRELMGFILSDHDFDYVEAENGERACEVFAEAPDIDLVLMDVNMPVMDGYEATKKIKQLSGDRLVPVVFVTALDDSETLTKCLTVGGDDFVAKPVNESVLLAKLIAHQRTINIHRQIEETNHTLEYHRRIMDREHAIVEHVFQNGLKGVDIDCNNLRFHVSPMSMFNGDLYLAAPSPSGGVYLLLGDFTGHGLSAAIGCLPVSSIFSTMAEKQASVGDIAREMNTRLQVEHPVTEAVYGVDLVREQIQVAAGESMSFAQKDIQINGHAIEVRINAEKLPNFAPCPGRISAYHAPGGLGVRMDSSLYNGYSIPPYYDSLIGKLIVHGRNRDEALARLRRALSELIIDGIDTTIPLFDALLSEEDIHSIISGNYSVLEKNPEFSYASYRMQYYNYTPKTIVEYYRKAYYLPINNIRITIDSNLSNYGFKNDFLNLKSFKSNTIQKSGYEILEIKFNESIPRSILNILSAFPVRQSAISKYSLSRLDSNTESKGDEPLISF